MVTARQLGPVAVNAGWSQTHQDVTVTPDASEIVVAGGQGGHFERTLNTYGAGATFSKFGLTLAADYRRDEADQQILRTDFINRDRYKFRVGWNWADTIRVGGTWQESHANDGDVADIGYNAKVREIAGGCGGLAPEEDAHVERDGRRVQGRPEHPDSRAPGLLDRAEQPARDGAHLGRRGHLGL